MIYPIKILSQLPLILKGFRKARGLTQAAMAERLGITQQSYAYFEANPGSATMERLYTVLRLLGVEIGLSQTYSVDDSLPTPPKVAQLPATYGSKTSAIATTKKAKPPVSGKVSRKITAGRKRESW